MPDKPVPLTESAIAALQKDFPAPPLGQPGAGTPPGSEAGLSTVSSAGTRRGGQTKCSNPGCKFSQKAVDQPCRVQKTGDKCLWCDPAKLEDALASETGRQRLRQGLNAFERRGGEALALARAKLPADFQGGQELCTALGCCFSRTAPGRAAQTNEKGTCSFCTFTHKGNLVAEVSDFSRRNLQQSLGAFAQKHPGVLQKAWQRLSADFKQGCEHFAAWKAQHQAEKRHLHREQQAMAAEDHRQRRVLQRENQAMWLEDFKRAQRCHPEAEHDGGKLGAKGPYWILKMPRPTCGHPHDDPTAWRSEMNTARPPPCPPCRICTHGYRATDPRPIYGSHYFPPGVHDSALVWNSKPEEEKQAYLKYQRDLDFWEEAQPKEDRLKRQGYSPMFLEMERNAKRRREAGLPHQGKLDFYYGFPHLGVPAALAAAAAKAGPKAKSGPSRPTDPDNRWFFTREQEAAMRRMGHGNIANDILRQHGLPVPEDDGFDPDHDGDWFE